VKHTTKELSKSFVFLSLVFLIKSSGSEFLGVSRETFLFVKEKIGLGVSFLLKKRPFLFFSVSRETLY